ncbi:hypothetical protein SAMN04488548_1071, partial [Gordonia westfalica]
NLRAVRPRIPLRIVQPRIGLLKDDPNVLRSAIEYLGRKA